MYKHTRHGKAGEDGVLLPWANVGLDLLGFLTTQTESQTRPLPQERAWLAPESKDVLDVSGEATLGLLLQLVLKGWESHVVEGQVKEQRFAGDGLESRREVHQAGLLGDKGRVQAEGLKPFNQGLEVKPKKKPRLNRSPSVEHSTPTNLL